MLNCVSDGLNNLWNSVGLQQMELYCFYEMVIAYTQKNIDLVNEARFHGVIILCFPPHTTHGLQIADVVFLRPLSNYDRQITAWLWSNPGVVVTMRQIAEIFGKAFVETCTMPVTVNNFRQSGVRPYDPMVFSESDFAPSLVTNIPRTQPLTTKTGALNNEFATVTASSELTMSNSTQTDSISGSGSYS